MAAMALLHTHELLLLAIVFLSCFFSHVSPALLSSSTTDRLALMSFRSLIRSDPTQALASWGNQSVPMCQWYGVACGLRGRRRGRVVALDLANLNLLGMISPALGNLTYMRRLYLPQNSFHGELPPELGNLRDLKTLHLKYNSIGGEIPPSLSNCSQLVQIALNNKKLHVGAYRLN